ncbi:MAG TPA: hypothetical protein VHO70_02205 [Chitinispirillaceae bacterium]|nr:hypothetical protein [Chitinispirillaceae bacterium]
MESGEVHGFSVRDLRIENEEFCKIWGCRSFKIGYSCHWCPVLSDLQRMARALNIKVQIAETTHEHVLAPVLCKEYIQGGQGVQNATVR